MPPPLPAGETVWDLSADRQARDTGDKTTRQRATETCATASLQPRARRFLDFHLLAIASGVKPPMLCYRPAFMRRTLHSPARGPSNQSPDAVLVSQQPASVLGFGCRGSRVYVGRDLFFDFLALDIGALRAGRRRNFGIFH